MAQAYDFALDKIGMEIMSYQVHTQPRETHSVPDSVLTAVVSHLFPLPSRFGWTTSIFSKECRCYFCFPCNPPQSHRAKCLKLSSFDFLSEAVGSYAENQRITAVRRVYQRGCVNPMINIEQLWRDYSKYEEASEPQRHLFLALYLQIIILLLLITIRYQA